MALLLRITIPTDCAKKCQHRCGKAGRRGARQPLAGGGAEGARRRVADGGGGVVRGGKKKKGPFVYIHTP